MTMRCQVICEDGPTLSEHEFPIMPRIGNVFVFPGQYTIYEVADVIHERNLSAGGDTVASSVAIVVKKKPPREVRVG